MSRGTRGPVGRAGRGPSGRAGGGPGRGGGCRKHMFAVTLAVMVAASFGAAACNPHVPRGQVPVESPRPLQTGRQQP